MNLAERIEELEAENEYLKSLLCPKIIEPPFGLTPLQYRIMLALYRGKGNYVSVDHIIESAYANQNGDTRGNNIVGVSVMAIRRKIRPMGLDILTKYRCGYALNEKTVKAMESEMKARSAGNENS